MPGGKVEENETFEITAARELFEETGFRAYNLKCVFERKEKDYVVRTFIPEKFYGTIPSDKKQKEKGEGRVRWISKEKLMEGSFGEYNRNLLKSLDLI